MAAVAVGANDRGRPSVDSGLGRKGGQHHGIAEFMEAKYIATNF
jgi:hypothetical protein